MRLLIAVASRHGATTQIAERIGETIRKASARLDVDVRSTEDITDVDGYDAVVLGSAVYMGRWLTSARRLVERQATVLATLPVWLFSSGPVGDPPRPDEDPVDVAAILETTDAREHRRFPGRLQRRVLGFAEKAVVAAVRAPDGDFRDWDAIDAWAETIGAMLRHLGADTMAGEHGSRRPR